MKEPDGYRQCLEWLNEATNNKAWLTVADISRLFGIDRHTVNRRFGIKSGCALPILAKRMVEESK